MKLRLTIRSIFSTQKRFGSSSLEEDQLIKDFSLSVFFIFISLLLWMHLSSVFLIDLELRDRLTLLVLFTSISIIALFLMKKEFKSCGLNIDLFHLCASVLLISSIYKENFFGDLNGVLWFGYGKYTVFVCLALISSIAFYPLHEIVFRWSYPLGVIAWVLFLFWYVPSFIQLPNGIIDIGHSMWVFNELLAPTRGFYPLSNFTAQYTQLFGWPLRLLAPFAIDPIMVLPYYLIFLVSIEILLIASIVRRMFKNLPWALAFLLPSAMIFVKPTESLGYAGSIAGLFSALPIRTLLPIFVGWLLTVNENRSYHNLKFAWFIGAAATLASLNNAEFGLPSLVSLLIVISVNTVRFPTSRKFNANILLSLACSTAMIWLLFAFFGHPIEVRRFLAFSVGFGLHNFGNVPMPTFGVWLFVFSILGSLVIVGLRTRKPFAPVVLYFSLWGLLSLPYYLGRSVVSGQLQISLIPMTIALFGFISFFVSYDSPLSTSIKIPSRMGKLPFVFLLSLPISNMIVQHPNPQVEISRNGGRGAHFDRFSLSQNDETSYLIRAYHAMNEKNSAVLGNFGIINELVYGIPFVFDQNHLEDATISSNLRALMCSAAISSPYDFLITPTRSKQVVDQCPGLTVANVFFENVTVYKIDHRWSEVPQR